MKATLIVGLPGSGKSWFGNKFKYFVDDPKEIPNLKKEDVAIADPYFCVPRIRTEAINCLSKLGFDVDCIYFENNPEKCKKNVLFRNDGRNVIPSIYNLSKLYIIPDGIIPWKIVELTKEN